MADYTAIEGVGRTLSTLLHDRMVEPVPVTITPLDRALASATGRRVNLFLYQVTENTHLKNQEIPGVGHPAAYGHPPLSLELHYLLTAFGSSEDGDDSDLAVHRILGDAMRVLHEHAVITERLVQHNDAAHPPVLDLSLHNQYEQVKITLEPISLEDLSKIWTSLTVAYRLSAAYRVSVVQIESQQPRHYPRPVGEPKAAGPRVYAVPSRIPHISELRVIRFDDPDLRERPYPYVRIGDTLVIRGRNLNAGDVAVRIDDLMVPVTSASSDRITLRIPDDSLPDGSAIEAEEQLQPGPRPVQVVQHIHMGEPPTPHLGLQSNTSVFMLVPYVERLDTSVAGQLTIVGTRLYHPDHECLTLIGNQSVPADAYAFASTATASTSIRMTLPELERGGHAVRVRVNGAESIDDVVLSV